MFGTSRIKQYQRMIETDGFDEAAHYRLATEYLKDGRYVEAAAKFRRAVELNPEYLEAWRGLGDAYKLAGVHKEAIAAWKTGRDVAGRLKRTLFAQQMEALLRQ